MHKMQPKNHCLHNRIQISFANKKKRVYYSCRQFQKFLKELTKDLFSEFQRGIKHRGNENQGPANLAPFCTIGPHNVCQAVDTACAGKMLQVP